MQQMSISIFPLSNSRTKPRKIVLLIKVFQKIYILTI